jgi:DNA-directed RNA polymerase specialized sigma24 family protein
MAAWSDSPRVAVCAERAAASARSDRDVPEHAAERFEEIRALLHAAEVSAEAAASHAAPGNRPRAVAVAEASRRLAKHCPGAWTPKLRLADAAQNKLTPREAEVAALARRGLPNAQVADRLILSRRTIHSHMQRIRMSAELDEEAISAETPAPTNHRARGGRARAVICLLLLADERPKEKSFGRGRTGDKGGASRREARVAVPALRARRLSRGRLSPRREIRFAKQRSAVQS